MTLITPTKHHLKSGQTVRLRSALPEDARAILNIRADVVAEGTSMLTEPQEFKLTIEQVAKAVTEHAEEPGYVYLVGEVDGRVVGLVHFENGHLRRTAHSGMLGIYIDRAWRDKGLGTILMQGLLDWAAANPLIEKVALAVFATNEPAIALYKKLGFREEGRCPRDMKLGPGKYIDSILMYHFVD